MQCFSHLPSFAMLTIKMYFKFFSLHGKPYFVFRNVLKRWSFQKIAPEYDLSCIIRKDDISFPRKYDLVLYVENERLYFFKKSTRKYDIFFKCSEKTVFPKKSHWNMIILLSSGKMTFLFPPKKICFLWTENER